MTSNNPNLAFTEIENGRVVTANHLLSGDVVYWTAKQDWSERLSDAQFFATQETAEAALLEASKQQHLIVGAYLADMGRNADSAIEPVHFREAFRTKGPSNYFHGKQATYSLHSAQL